MASVLSFARRRPTLCAVLTVFLAQLAFTTFVRAYLVPHLVPASHWMFGLQKLSDSQFFQEEATRLAEAARANGPASLTTDLFQGLGHARVIAILYYVFGQDNPWIIYVLNAGLAGLTTWLLVLIGTGSGLPRVWAALLSALLALSPLFLFLHSELLREPFFLPAVELIWLGCLTLVYPEGRDQRSAGWPVVLGAGLAVAFGFVWSTSLRPYLMLPLLASLLLAFGVSAAWRLAVDWKSTTWRPGHLALLATLILVSAGFVRPSASRVEQYDEHGGHSSESLAQIQATAHERSAELQQASASTGAGLTRENVLIPHACTIQWQASGLLPGRVERALESLACARQEYQLYCDPAVYGVRIDRNCDTRVFTSAAQLARQLPYSVIFSLFAPFPNMWVAGFGSGGTGLRRVGYVVDGVTSYVLLPGLLGLWIRRRGLPSGAPLGWLALGLLAVVVSYGIAVPTQFILARMRLGFYSPLLILAAVGWMRIIGALTYVWHRRSI